MESRKANHAVPSWPRSTLNQIKWKIIFRKTTSHNSDASQSRGGGQQNWFWGYKSLRQGDGLLFLQEGLPTKPLLQQHIEICPHTHTGQTGPSSLRREGSNMWCKSHDRCRWMTECRHLRQCLQSVWEQCSSTSMFSSRCFSSLFFYRSWGMGF